MVDGPTSPQRFSSTAVWSPILNDQEIGREEALCCTERIGFISNKLGNWRSVIDSDLRAGLGGSLLSAAALGVLYKKGYQQHDA